MQNGHASLVSALEDFNWPAKAAAELSRGAHIVPYEKRSIVFHAGETADLVYMLLSGEVKLQFDADVGASLLVSIARAGQMLGVFAPDARLSGAAKPEQLFTAQALSRCKVAIIPTARVAHALHHLPAEHLVRVLERSREQWMHLCCRLLSFLTMSVRRRLTHTIAEIADSFGVADARGRLITLRLSHEDFAALVGASRPMVSKHLKELTSEGVLTRQHGRYVVLLPQPGAAAGENGDEDGAAAVNGSRNRRQVVGLGEVRARGRALTGTSRGSDQARETFRVRTKGPVRSI
jgi:CRP/FNR family transcriptional regulator, cyclic AMP receptor protein